MEDKISLVVGETDYWTSPTVQIFAFIGLLWLSLKIFSFWRMITSLFFLPGISVSSTPKLDGAIKLVLAIFHGPKRSTDSHASSPNSARKALGR